MLPVDHFCATLIELVLDPTRRFITMHTHTQREKEKLFLSFGPVIFSGPPSFWTTPIDLFFYPPKTNSRSPL